MKYRIKYVDNSILKCRVENGLRDKTDKTKNINRQPERQKYDRTDRLMDGRTDRWTDGRTN